jgi:large subunit ribosomal protein L9
MRVILVEDVNKLGKLGDVVDVKRGFARNFLFPRKLAIEATDNNLRLLEQKKRKREQQLAREKQEMEELARRITGISCTIPMMAGDEDKLFGSVTAEHIAEAFFAEGIKIDKRHIYLPEPIRKLGVYQVEIKLHPEITTSAKVWVVKK